VEIPAPNLAQQITSRTLSPVTTSDSVLANDLGFL